MPCGLAFNFVGASLNNWVWSAGRQNWDVSSFEGYGPWSIPKEDGDAAPAPPQVRIPTPLEQLFRNNLNTDSEST